MEDAATAPALISPTPPAAIPETPWPLAFRVLFRFLAIYYVLYCIGSDGRVSILQLVPGLALLVIPWLAMWHAVCPWVAIQLFGLSGAAVTYRHTGSGDTEMHYVAQFLFVAIAIAGAIVWSALDRKRAGYRALHVWLRLLVRYTLALTLLTYGLAKVFPLQFPAPQLSTLIAPFGEQSPMRVLWNFMGASTPYTIFSGSAELFAAVLLLFRRTAMLGALVAFAVMCNVVALNYCYDVSVKLYSSNLLLMAVFLLIPDLRRLVNVLVLNRGAEPADLSAPRFERRWVRKTATVCWAILVGLQLVGGPVQTWIGYREIMKSYQKPALYGIYEAADRSSALGRSTSKAVFDTGMVMFQMADGQRLLYEAEYDNAHFTVTVNHDRALHWRRTGENTVAFDGAFYGTDLPSSLRRVDKQFRLLSSSFHWVN
jgi:uncharacterized membrane protein YphA (DoxX/SURF4 family)